MAVILTIIYVAILLVALAIGAQNGQIVTVNLLAVNYSLPLSTVIALSVVLGMLLSFINRIIKFLKQRLFSSRSKKA